MNYNVMSAGFSITQEIREYLEKKLGALDRFVSNASRADMHLEFLSSEAKQYYVELTLHDPALKHSPHAEARGSSLHEALDAVVSELSRELSQGKQKRLHVLRHQALKVKEYLRGWRRDV